MKNSFRWKIDPKKRLKDLKKSLRNKILRRAVKKASAEMKADMKTRVPQKAKRSRRNKGKAPTSATGTLKMSIGTKQRVDKKKDVVVGYVGAKSGYKKQFGTISRGPRKGSPRFRHPARYQMLLERGSKGRTGRGRMPKMPFLEKTLKAGWNSYSTTMMATIREELAKVIA